jgi:hypothetical protein
MNLIYRWITRRRNQRRLDAFLVQQGRKSKERVQLTSDIEFVVVMMIFGTVLAFTMGAITFCSDLHNKINYEEVYGEIEYLK